MKNVSIIPFYPSQHNNELFKLDSKINRDGALEPYVELKQRLNRQGVEISTVDILPIDCADKILFFDLDLKKLTKAFFLGKLDSCIYIAFEPPAVNTLHNPQSITMLSKVFSSVLTWQDEIIDNNSILKFYFPMPRIKRIHSNIAFKDKKLITTVVGYKTSTHPDELYSKRVEAIRFFEQLIPEQFDFYGAGWDERQYSCYRGKVESKFETMAKYRFTLCYENQHNIKGLISEKIFDCFHAKCIPIFWGASNVEEYIPQDCFIDKRAFSTYQSLLNYLTSMSEQEFNIRIKAINKYLLSDEYKLHSCENFSENIFDVLCEAKEVTPIHKQVLPLVQIIYLKTIYKLKRKIIQLFR